MSVGFDRRLYRAMAILAALVVLAGFSRTFYLRLFFSTEPLSVLRYVHGSLMTLWYALFLTQVLLIARRRVDVHRRLGIVAALTAAALVIAGVATAVAFVARTRTNPEDGPVAAVIAGFDLVSLAVFTMMVATALALRTRPDIHKRLMTLASLSLLGPPLARLVPDETAVWLTYALVLLPVVIDTWRHRRLHPAFGWGSILILLSSQVSLQFAASPRWIDFALRTFT